MGLLVTTVLLVALCAVMLQLGLSLWSKSDTCPISLPQDVRWYSLCNIVRQASLAEHRGIYGIKEPTPAMPFSRLELSIPEFALLLATNPFLRSHAGVYVAQAIASELQFKHYLDTSDLPKILQLPEYASHVQYCKKELETLFNWKGSGGLRVSAETSLEKEQENTMLAHILQTTLNSTELVQISSTHKVPVSLHRKKWEAFIGSKLSHMSEPNACKRKVEDRNGGQDGEENESECAKTKRRNIEENNKELLNIGLGYVKYPSSIEPFQADVTKWISDQHFAEQRLAGINPMTLQKVTFSTKVGMNWDDLKKKLNTKFDWEQAIRRGIEHNMTGKSLDWAIEHGYIYVLYHPLNDHINSMPDISKNDSHRRMWDYLSPITLFVSAPGKHTLSESRLMPVAIQMSSNPDSKVYTPNDGDLWLLAKLNVQLTDMECSQVVEHLSKCHFVTEALCLSIERQLSKRHPLYAAMKYHCRGILVANTFGGPSLLSPQGILHNLFEFGDEGANYLVKEISKILDWNDLDFKSDLEKRGVDDYSRLPYFPYRDDGDEVHAVMNNMASDYVDAYYHENSDVTEDNELQNFVNEVSAEGTGPSGGKGKLRGFPTEIENKQQLVQLFTQMIWLMSGRHAAVNYPLADYASYIPNMPAKLYDDDRVYNATFSTARLPNRETTAKQVTTNMQLASLRYDRLFDYGELLDDPKGREVLYRYFSVLTEIVEPILDERNKRRLEDGQLTYPYMLPRWLTNGIQT